jgi:hypothetical protein
VETRELRINTRLLGIAESAEELATRIRERRMRLSDIGAMKLFINGEIMSAVGLVLKMPGVNMVIATAHDGELDGEDARTVFDIGASIIDAEQSEVPIRRDLATELTTIAAAIRRAVARRAEGPQ